MVRRLGSAQAEEPALRLWKRADRGLKARATIIAARAA